MRVTTGMIYDTGLASIQKQNSRVLDSMEQAATGRRIRDLPLKNQNLKRT